MKEDGAIKYAMKFAIASLLTTVAVFLIALLFTSYLQKRNSDTPTPVFNETHQVCFVIDPGHGGEDAGAVATDGTCEKDLNLQVASLLSTVLELNGCRVVMTRETDTLLYDKYGVLDDYTGKKKVYDLKNRLKIAQETENSIYVGIHMNKFPEEKYSGLQVYYSQADERSQELALTVSGDVKSYLQPHNNRPIKRANSSIYILNEAEMPAILIECGFLSNEAELELLKSPEYQKSLALCLFYSLSKHNQSR